MAPPNFFRFLYSGITIISRATHAAYKEAVANAARARATGAHKAADSSNIRNSSSQMSLDEACKILNIEKDSAIEKVEERYRHLFKVNDKTSRGSPYIQAKVVRAKERWLLEKTPEELEEIKKVVQKAQENDPLPK